jgi:hypothetical protein
MVPTELAKTTAVILALRLDSSLANWRLSAHRLVSLTNDIRRHYLRSEATMLDHHGARRGGGVAARGMLGNGTAGCGICRLV